MRRAVFISLIMLTLASLAQGPSGGASAGRPSGGLPSLNGRVGPQVTVIDPHKNPNPYAEQIEDIGSYKLIDVNLRGNSGIRQVVPRCAPDDNLVTVLRWLTNEQSVQLELAKEKSNGKCGNDEILKQIKDVISTYKNGATK